MEAWQCANGVISAVGALLLAYVVMHPDIHEGPLMKVGFMIMSVSLSVTAFTALTGSEDWLTMWKAGFWFRAGMCVVGLGVIHRVRRLPRYKRRMRDILNIQ